jgi:7,8-dihydropterin-6-yl-methyl-4-(beta-D-ribofuranosyl)aminobenzene 5'-phosphate synthase
MTSLISTILIVGLMITGQEKHVYLEKEGTPMKRDSIRLTILYDNYSKREGTKADWGFACLIEGLDKTILFDTGADTSILKQNMNQMRIDPASVDLVVISHMHWDHTGGLDYVLGRNRELMVYLPASADEAFVEKIRSEHHQVRQQRDAGQILDNVYLSGEMGTSIKEQSLIIDTSEGLVVITGCSHPGIDDILRQARRIIDKKIALVAGGFHLLRMDAASVNAVLDQFEKIGVEKCAASHCTGDEAIDIIKKRFGENFVPLGTGAVINL